MVAVELSAQFFQALKQTQKRHSRVTVLRFYFLQNKTWSTDRPELRQGTKHSSPHAACRIARELNASPDPTMECIIPMFTHLPT